MASSSQYSSIQSIAWETGVQAIKDSANFGSFDEFRHYLLNSTAQNSETVRDRYSNLIIKRLFPEHRIDGLNPAVWRAYQDDKILIDLARLTTLEAEPVIAKFVQEYLFMLPLGTLISSSTIRDFISAVYGSFKEDSYKRLQASLIKMGYAIRSKQGVMVQPIPRPDDAMLIVLHARLAPTQRIIRVADILPLPFWKLLGIQNESDVRAILKQAETKRLIARYAVVDQLEQITTHYSYAEYLRGAFRL